MKSIKRLFVLVIILSMIIGGSTLAFANNSDLREIEDVKVYIDGVQFQTKEDFYNFRGTTLVPMRALFEKLGAKVTWKQDSQTVVAKSDDRTIELGINQKKAKINGKGLDLVVEPELIDDTTYVPLRFVAESFMYEVDWNSTYKIISIIDTKTIDEQKQLKVYVSSSNFKDDYVVMEIVDNKTIRSKGRTDLEKTDWLFKVENNSNQEIIKEFKEIKSDSTYGDRFSLNSLRKGVYKTSIYFKENNDSMYWSYYWKIPLESKDGEIFFPVSPVYKNNYFQYMKNSVIDPENYLDTTIYNESERKEIEDLAKDIIKGARTDYDKLIKINDWVAQNVYYNWDGYLAGSYGRTDAYGTLKARRSVCQGYAELTNELLRSVGIPSRLVSGHALGVSASGGYWDSVNNNSSNHAWNEAYVDGRWVILDTTWNSGNKYENGTFIKGAMKYRYFDPDLEAFSYTHKIMRY